MGICGVGTAGALGARSIQQMKKKVCGSVQVAAWTLLACITPF